MVAAAVRDNVGEGAACRRGLAMPAARDACELRVGAVGSSCPLAIQRCEYRFSTWLGVSSVFDRDAVPSKYAL